MATAISDDVRFKDANDVALKFLAGSAIGLVIVVLVGLTMSLEVTSLGVRFSGLFLQLRGLHLQAIIFAWLSMALMGAILYAVPRIVGRDLYSRTLGNLHFVLIWVGILLVTVTLLAGYSEGREYLEPIFIIDVAVVIVWLIFFANVMLTILTSGAKETPYSLKFIVMGILYLGINYLTGMVPLTGLQDAVAVWTFAHNQVNGWFMLTVMGLMYWALPKLTGLESNPPYNTKLSHVHFWALMVFIPPSVLHHLLYREIPVNEFWKEVGQWTSVGMLIPTVIWTYIVYSYLRNSKKGFTLPLKFVATSIVFYFLNCVQGATQSIRAVNDLTHGTQWTIGHAHLALIGWISFGVLAMFYFLYPMVSKKPVYSEGMAMNQLWLGIIGLLLMWISLSIGGLIQGSILDSGGGYYAAKQALEPYLMIRVLGGIAYALSAILFLYNAFATLRQPSVEVALEKAAQRS